MGLGSNIHLWVLKHSNLVWRNFLPSSAPAPSHYGLRWQPSHPKNRPGKSCKLSSSKKFIDLECPQNSVTRDKRLPELCVLIWWCGMMKSLNLKLPILNSQPFILHVDFLYLYSPSSYHKSPLSNLHCPSSTILLWFSAKSARNWTENVLKIAGFPTKCPQAPLAAFSRSAEERPETVKECI